MAANTYTTVQGDTWDSIAYRLWGEERHMDSILACNPEYSDVLVFPAGMSLCLPDTSTVKITKTSELPPWM